MHEIEKLYENAKVYDFRYDCDVSFTDGQFGRITNCSRGEVIDYCTDKKYFKSAKVINCKHLYPPFTAKKQLNLIKFLFNHNVYYDVDEKGNYWFHITDDCYTYYYNKFEIALANIINEMWQDLTSEEKEQIRSVLK